MPKTIKEINEKIRKGQVVVVDAEEGEPFIELDWLDPDPLRSDKKYYYRIMARSYLKKNSFILSNPIFVKEK